MAGIDVSVAGVVALYDACTGFPVRSSSIQLFTDGDKEPLYKGNGVYVLIKDERSSINITAEVKGYHIYKEVFATGKENAGIPQKIIWLVPDKNYKGYREYSNIKIKAASNGKYNIFIKCKNEQLRLSKEKAIETDRMRLFYQNSISYEGRNILITDNNKEYIARLVKLIDENTCQYQLDKELSLDMLGDRINIYKGYEITSDDEGYVEFVVPYIVGKDTELVVYNDAEEIIRMEDWRII